MLDIKQVLRGTRTPQELCSQAAPVTRAGKILQYPLTRILAAIGFLIPILILNKGMKAGLFPLLSEDVLIFVRYLEAILFFLLFLAAFRFYAKHIEKRKAFEIVRRGCLSETGSGLLAAGIIVGLVVIALAMTGCYSILGVISNKRLVLDLFLRFFMSAFLEELLFRLIIFKLTEELVGTWIALLIQALLFGFAHAANENATLFTSCAVAIVGGLPYTAAYIYSRSLWLPLGLHWGWNFFQSGIFSMPNSGTPYQGLFTNTIAGPTWLTGGDFGIEASYLTILLWLLAGIALLFLAKKNSQIVMPRWKRSVLSNCITDQQTKAKR
jgi:membrane protease YdiL (CAAX protease family)